MITAFPDLKHRNRKLFCIVRAHYLLQHFNDLAKGADQQPVPRRGAYAALLEPMWQTQRGSGQLFF
jgi:hypothetical protein